jgi:hypothetical protein
MEPEEEGQLGCAHEGVRVGWLVEGLDEVDVDAVRGVRLHVLGIVPREHVIVHWVDGRARVARLERAQQHPVGRKVHVRLDRPVEAGGEGPSNEG